jgi:fatty acid CoA ligase FadD9
MSTDTREERLDRRISDLYGSDQQFADARPIGSIMHAIASRELRLADVVQTVVNGYADRPALGQRSIQDASIRAPSGACSLRLL